MRIDNQQDARGNEIGSENSGSQYGDKPGLQCIGNKQALILYLEELRLVQEISLEPKSRLAFAYRLGRKMALMENQENLVPGGCH